MSSVVSEAACVVGARIRDERRRFAISQEELAELADVHLTNVGKIERGQANPSLHALVRLATALNLNPAVLVDGLTADQLRDRPHTVTVADLIRARRAAAGDG